MNLKKVTSLKQQKVARYAKAMGHPVRMYVLDLFSNQAFCYNGNIMDDLPIAKATLSQHFQELKEAGLIQGEIESPGIRYCRKQENWKEAQQLYKEFLIR